MLAKSSSIGVGRKIGLEWVPGRMGGESNLTSVDGLCMRGLGDAGTRADSCREKSLSR